MSGNMYDWDTSIYSQEGRVYQIEYACKGIETAETIIGVVCKDGVVLASEKLVLSKLLIEDTNRRIYHIDKALGAVVTGRIPDGRHLISHARADAENYNKTFGLPITGPLLADRLGLKAHDKTIYARSRPYGAAVIIAGYDVLEGYTLNMVEPSGVAYGYTACAIGKGKQIAKSEFDKQNFKDKTCKEALFFITKLLTQCHDEFKEKKFEIEISVISKDNGNTHQILPREVRRDLEKQAAEAIEKEQMGL